MSLTELPATVSFALDKPGIVERFLKQQNMGIKYNKTIYTEY